MTERKDIPAYLDDDEDSGPRTVLSVADTDMPSWADTQTTDVPIELLIHSQEERRPMIRQVTGPGAPRDLVFTREKMIVGRSKAADFMVDSPELSRQHIAIERDGVEYTVTDLNSRNGLYMNGIQVHAFVLRPGDTIQIGNVTFVYREGI